MSSKKNKTARVFMFIAGVILFLSGIIVLLAGKDSLKDTLINNFAFFLTGGILIYLGLTWNKKKS